MELGDTIKIEKIRSGGKREKKEDIIPREILLHLYLNGNKISVISCSPDDLMELAAGYVLSHGYVDTYKSINIIELCEEDKKEIKDSHGGTDAGKYLSHDKD